MSRNFTPDAVLVDRLPLDDTKAFEELFHRYCLPLYCYCIDKLNSPADAKLITRRIFVDLWEKRHRLPIGFTITFHLYTEVRKAVIQCINDKLGNTNDIPGIEERIIPGFKVNNLKRARQPVKNVLQLKERITNTTHKEGPSPGNHLDAYIFKNVRYALQKVMNLI